MPEVEIEVGNNAEERRYEARVDGELVGINEYSLSDGLISFTHAQVDPSRRHHGIGSILVRRSLDDVRESSDLTVRPLCSFVRAYIRDNPEYQDLLEPRSHPGSSD